MNLVTKTSVLNGVQTLFRHLGLQIGFDHPIRNAPKLFAVKAAELQVVTVLDIGANKGQFARELRRYGYRKRLVSFEPLSSAYATLCKAAKDDALWDIAPRMALGSAEGTAEINISKNLASSSLLAVNDRSVSAAAESAFAGTEAVAVRRLDDVIEARWGRPFGLKLDTQGFELHVLQGAAAVLASTELVVVEMSLAGLYDEGARFVDLYRVLEESGFRCISLVQGFADNVRHELLQVDGVFVREHPSE